MPTLHLATAIDDGGRQRSRTGRVYPPLADWQALRGAHTRRRLNSKAIIFLMNS